MKKLIPQSIKNVYHLFQAVLANVWYGFPSRRLKVVGVTGTNGKTTTVQMIARILEEAGYKVAVSSTINFKIGSQEEVNTTKFTTLSSWQLQKFLREAAEAGCEWVVMEVSSHSLDQNRVWGIRFDVAVVTNITREHLDYHKTMKGYAKSKKRLFEMISENPKGVSVVNLDMKFAKDFLECPAKEKFGYAVEIPNFKFQSLNKFQSLSSKFQTVIAEEIELGVNYSKFKVSVQRDESAASRQGAQFILNLPGRFNIENALAAICVGLSQGISLEKISEALAKLKEVPGRIERIENDRGIEIIVDYAVTPDSLEKLYEYIEQIRSNPQRFASHSRIIAVFGACGERDRGKRPIMGEIVARYADYVIVTNEDPYGEPPFQIINEVFSGVVGEKITSDIPNFQFPISNLQAISNSQISKIKKEGENAFRVLDRREAIKKALQIARPGDIVVVTGKGAEETMAVGEKRIPWNDPKMIREVLLEIKKEESQ